MQSHLFLGAMVVGALATSTAISAITPHDLVSLSAEITDVPSPGQFRGAEAAADSESADETNAQEPTPGLASVECEVAQVNPVTGHAECIRPRGAAVDPPPQSAVPCSAHHAAGEKRGCPQLPPDGDSSRTH